RLAVQRAARADALDDLRAGRPAAHTAGRELRARLGAEQVLQAVGERIERRAAVVGPVTGRIRRRHAEAFAGGVRVLVGDRARDRDPARAIPIGEAGAATLDRGAIDRARVRRAVRRDAARARTPHDDVFE